MIIGYRIDTAIKCNHFLFIACIAIASSISLHTAAERSLSIFSKRQFGTHMRTHSGEKPILCNESDKGYSTISSSQRHMGTQTGEKPYVTNVVYLTRGFLRTRR